MNNLSPRQVYEQQIENKLLVPDESQAVIIKCLDEIYTSLAQKQKNNWFQSLFATEKNRVNGLYVWGGVGVGKTHMMDIFYNCLPPDRKMRLHFYAFMKMVHQQLTEMQGHKDPLRLIAKKLATKIDVICFDEFLVQDITDAMILAELLRALFAEHICLIMTSNTEPDQLYLNGLQRESFLPAIDLIKTHTKVIHAVGNHDYRLSTLQNSGVYYQPLNDDTSERFRQRFMALASGDIKFNEKIMIEGRYIQTVAHSHGIVWFEFNHICHVPRSQLDYLDIANIYPMVFISDIPKLHSSNYDAVHYLINLIDIFYDAKVKLILSAETVVNELYTHGALLNEFQRTKSRLIEMQSEEYLGKAHLLRSNF